jgi:hypothetical protein
MSEELMIGLVCEGPTDGIVIAAALRSMLGERRFILKRLQPEESLPIGTVTGWCGVYKWCKSSSRRAGKLREDVVFSTYQLLIIQVDADVAEKSYAECGRGESGGDLPCHKPCPPPSATTNPLRSVVLRWAAETDVPPKTVLCTPSKSMEAWVLTALFPEDKEVKRSIECLGSPVKRLRQQPAKNRIEKTEEDYAGKAEKLQETWPAVVEKLSEARRFQEDFLAELPRGSAAEP